MATAPGRVNLIGEHTDYQEGFVFPAAIDLKVWIAAGPSSGLTELTSEIAGDAPGFDVTAIKPGDLQDSWAKYPAGAAWAVGAESNIRAAVVSTLPAESGVSSSAAVEVGFGTLWNLVDTLGFSPKEIALRSQIAESRFVGMPCGIMDQMASAMGRAGCAMSLDTRSLEIRYAPIPDGISFVVCHTGKTRQLAGSEYADRRAQCEEACTALGIKALRDATPEEVEASSLTGLPRMRARHVTSENRRCQDFSQALAEGRLNDVGRLMAESHESLKRDFEVSCPELDAMAKAASTSKGCIGARLTGAGFGGACIALVESGHTEGFAAETEANYAALMPERRPRLISCRPTDGASAEVF
jgi:galactokinase